MADGRKQYLSERGHRGCTVGGHPDGLLLLLTLQPRSFRGSPRLESSSGEPADSRATAPPKQASYLAAPDPVGCAIPRLRRSNLPPALE